MRALIQRVNWTRLVIAGEVHAEIGPGLLAFIGMEKGDDSTAVDKLLHKVLSYRVFADAEGKIHMGIASMD